MPVRKDSHRVQLDIPLEWMPELDELKETQGVRLSQHAILLMIVREGMDSLSEKGNRKRRR